MKEDLHCAFVSRTPDYDFSFICVVGVVSYGRNAPPCRARNGDLCDWISYAARLAECQSRLRRQQWRLYSHVVLIKRLPRLTS